MTTRRRIDSLPMMMELFAPGASPSNSHGQTANLRTDWHNSSAVVGGECAIARYFDSAPRNDAAVIRRNTQRLPAAIRGNARPPTQAKTETIAIAKWRWGAIAIRHRPNAVAMRARRI